MHTQRAHKQRPEKALAPVREEVARIFAEAEGFFTRGDKRMAQRRVKQARRLAMKVQLRIPEHAHRYCRACDSFVKEGVNATVRIRGKVRIRRCLGCGAVRRKLLV
jgi:RNase P subunit RPR2